MSGTRIVTPIYLLKESFPDVSGGTDYSLFRASGDFNGHIINEIKLMVLCSEVLEAEKIISELKL